MCPKSLCLLLLLIISACLANYHTSCHKANLSQFYSDTCHNLRGIVFGVDCKDIYLVVINNGQLDVYKGHRQGKILFVHKYYKPWEDLWTNIEKVTSPLSYNQIHYIGSNVRAEDHTTLVIYSRIMKIIKHNFNVLSNETTVDRNDYDLHYGISSCQSSWQEDEVRFYLNTSNPSMITKWECKRNKHCGSTRYTAYYYKGHINLQTDEQSLAFKMKNYFHDYTKMDFTNYRLGFFASNKLTLFRLSYAEKDANADVIRFKFVENSDRRLEKYQFTRFLIFTNTKPVSIPDLATTLPMFPNFPMSSESTSLAKPKSISSAATYSTSVAMANTWFSFFGIFIVLVVLVASPSLLCFFLCCKESSRIQRKQRTSKRVNLSTRESGQRSSTRYLSTETQKMSSLREKSMGFSVLKSTLMSAPTPSKPLPSLLYPLQSTR